MSRQEPRPAKPTPPPEAERELPAASGSGAAGAAERSGARRSDGSGGAPARASRRPSAEALPRAPVPDSEVLQAIQDHGRCTTAFQSLKPGLDRLRVPGGVVCYRDTGGAWVAAGDPLTAPERADEAREVFFEGARVAGRRPSIFASEQPPAIQNANHRWLKVGEQPVIDPALWPQALKRSRNLRQQLRRARNKGVKAAPLSATAARAPGGGWPEALDTLEGRWLASKALPPLGFIVGLTPLAHAQQRRLFVAWQGDRLVGFASLSPVPARRGQLLEELVRDPSAPNGTTELLADAALRCAAEAGCRRVTLGLAPLAGATDRWLKFAAWAGEGLYRFRQLHRYKSKFLPQAWESVYCVYPASSSNFVAIYDSLQAFAGHGFVLYGIGAWLRGSPAVLRALGVLLLPWMGLLALAPAHWFALAWMRPAWIGFDSLLAGALVAQSSRPRGWLGRCLLGSIAFDVTATWLLAAFYNAPRLRSMWEGVLLAVVCAAPALGFAAVAGAQSALRQRAPEGCARLSPRALDDLAGC